MGEQRGTTKWNATRLRLGSPLAVALVASRVLTGCEASGQSHAVARGHQSAPIPSAGAPAASSRAGGTRTVNLSVVVEASSSAEAWTVAWVAPELGMKSVVGSVPVGTLCGMLDARKRMQPLKRRMLADGYAGVIVTCAADGLKTSSHFEPGELRIDGKRRVLPDGVQVRLPENVQYPATKHCVGDAKELVDVRVRRMPSAGKEDEGNGNELVLSLGTEELQLGRVPSDRPMACGCDRTFPKSTEMRCRCSSGEGGLTLHIEAERGAIWVERQSTGYHEPIPQFRFGRRLPCEVGVRLHSVQFRDKGWEPYGDPCQNRCSQHERRCEGRCYGRHADDEGNLDDAGMVCTERCNLRGVGCAQACLELTRPRPVSSK